MSKKLRNILRATKEYEEVCMTCKDEILTYPSISGRTNYTDEEVEELTLKQIIDNLQAKEQECEELKKENLNLKSTQYHLKNELKKHKKAVHKYKVVLQRRIDRLHLSRRELLRELNSIPKKIACTSEVLKVPLDKFNNAIQVINNEDRYKQVLERIKQEVKWVVDNRECYDLRDADRCERILDIINNKVRGTNEG